MIKRTLYFGNPAYLSLTRGQLQVRLPEVEKNEELPVHFKKEAVHTVPVEDLGLLVLDHQQVTITQALLAKCMEMGVVVISCDEKHHPAGLLFPVEGHSLQQERFEQQINATLPLKKQLWAQTITCKIQNQATLLRLEGQPTESMAYWSGQVRSGDPDNYEARAASYYWPRILKRIPNFKREREGASPNNLLNYGYAVLRAVVARGLVGAGLLPALGIHHHNRYNAFCLADDIMEPYRPVVDQLVLEMIAEDLHTVEMDKRHKQWLLNIPYLDVLMGGERSPLMVGVQKTCTSLVNCYAGTARKLIYPEIAPHAD